MSTLRTKRSRPGALDRRAGEPGAEGGIVEAGQLRQRQRRQIVPLHEPRLAAGLRELVPGADGEAIVAAEDPVADARRAAPPEYGPYARW